MSAPDKPAPIRETLPEHLLPAARRLSRALWKLAYERIEKQNVETGKRVDLIHEREAFRADRDRLAQEHDELLAEFHEYAEHQSWRCGHAPHYYLVGGEALESCPCGLDEVLARFPLATEKAEQASETAAREAVDGA